MSDEKKDESSGVAWFVGASFGGTEDQTDRFIADGVWKVSRPQERERVAVRSMRVGERIAIKATYVRRHDLPFDNRERPVSTMAIKAIGTILHNPMDGEHLQVQWKRINPLREWYFYTYRATIWRVEPGEPNPDALLAFTFQGVPQDIDRFRNAPYWRERFGSVVSDKERFAWTKFYEAIADKLLTYRNNRTSLVEGIREISERVEGLGHLREDKYADGTTGFVRDICPFTTMGLFNRGITDSNRKIIAIELAKLLGVEEPVPETFEGTVLNNLKSWFFPFELDRAADHIDSLWNVFDAGIGYADADDDLAREEFAKSFDSANGRQGVAWNLTFGLYWSRPWSFLSLDRNSKIYIGKKLGVSIGFHGPKKRALSRFVWLIFTHSSVEPGAATGSSASA